MSLYGYKVETTPFLKTLVLLKSSLVNALMMLNIFIKIFRSRSWEVLRRCLTLAADAVEIHTGEYAKDALEKKEDWRISGRVTVIGGYGDAGQWERKRPTKP